MAKARREAPIRFALFVGGVAITGMTLCAVAMLRQSPALYIVGVAIIFSALVVLGLLMPRRALAVTAIIVAVGAGVAAVVVPARAAAVRANEPTGDIVDAYDVVAFDAWMADDAIVMRTANGVVVAAPGDEFAEIEAEDGLWWLGSGDVTVLNFLDKYRVDGVADLQVTAFSADGSELWRVETDGAISSEPVAAFVDGTVVIETCRPLAEDAEQDSDDSGCELIAIEPSGLERWRTAVSRSWRAAPTTADQEGDDREDGHGLPSHLVGLIHNRTGPSIIEAVDERTGQRREIGRGEAVAVGRGFDAMIAVMTGSSEACSIEVHDDQLRTLFTIDRVRCTAHGWLRFVGGHLDVFDAETVTSVDLASQRVTTLELPQHLHDSDGEYRRVVGADTSGAGVVARTDDDTWLVGANTEGPPTFQLDEPWSLRDAGSEAVVAARPVDSRNPFLSADVYEVAVFDPATGERCAAATVPASSISVAPYSDCRALVFTSDTTYLVGA